MKKKKIESYLGLARRAGKIVSGYQTCVHTISKGNIKLIIVASDASENTRDRFKNLCSRYFVTNDRIYRQGNIRNHRSEFCRSDDKGDPE